MCRGMKSGMNKSLASKLLLNNSRCIGKAERTKISRFEQGNQCNKK